MKQYDIAIIGGGPAGLNALYFAQQVNLNACLIEANNSLGGQPAILYPIKLIHDYPEFKEIRANDLITYFINKIKNKSNIFLNTSVSFIGQVENGYELTTNNEPIKAKYVIIATGGGFFKFNKIEGIDHDSIHYRIEDLEKYRNKKVIVCGGGDSAIDWTWELLTNNITDNLTLIHRRNEFRAKGPKVDEVTHSKVKVLLNKTSRVVDQGFIEVIDNETKKVDTLPYDYLLVLYGQTYSLLDNKMLKPFNLDIQNRIVVDDKCLTNVGDIYAIGNVSNYNNKPKLIHVAVSDAQKAINDIVSKVRSHE